eukprot:528356_1
MSYNEKFEIRNSGFILSQCGIFATVDIKEGELVYDWSDNALVMPQKTSHTMQIGVNKHILYGMKYCNHSCDPNVYHDFKNMKCYALRYIKRDEELTRFYCCSEWEMVAPFLCLCGSGRCCKYVGGAKYLSLQTISQFAHYLAPHIKSLLREDIKLVTAKL